MRKITKTVRGYTFNWYSEKELLEIFPEVIKVLPLKLAEQQEEYDRQVENIKWIFTTVEKGAPQDMWFYEILAKKLLIPDLLKVENNIFHLKRLLALANGKTGSNRRQENFEERKNVAKNFPIYELARSQIPLKPSGRNFVGLCPLHTERTPSFYLYTETNSFYCFGCQAGGDVITLTMRLHGIGFTDAVAMLQK